MLLTLLNSSPPSPPGTNYIPSRGYLGNVKYLVARGFLASGNIYSKTISDNVTATALMASGSILRNVTSDTVTTADALTNSAILRNFITAQLTASDSLITPILGLNKLVVRGYLGRTKGLITRGYGNGPVPFTGRIDAKLIGSLLRTTYLKGSM